MVSTPREGVVALWFVGGSRRGVRRWVLACLVLLLMAGLAARAPTAMAATRASHGPLASNPFAVRSNVLVADDTSSMSDSSPRYAKAVLADHPTVYYRFNETSGSTAFDSSGNGLDATYAAGVSLGEAGGLIDEPDSAVFGSGLLAYQSGDALPSGAKPRTLEIWVHNAASAYNPISYGDVEHGHGFVVHIGQEHITVEAGEHQVSAATLDGLGRTGLFTCCDRTGWHMVDVTYDGSNVEIYQDGQLIGGGMLGEVETDVPGQGLRLAASADEYAYGYDQNQAGPYGLDEAAAYPSVLSSARIVAHWEAASQAPAGSSVIAGEAVVNGHGGAEGARVQACPTSGGACQIDRHAVDAQGVFHMVVPNGTYTVTIFPPAGSPDGPKTIGPVTLPPSALNLNAIFSPPGGLPEGVSLSSPGRGTQENTVPGLNWGEPSTVTVKGCKGGYGFVFVHATNTSNGQSEVRAVPLKELSPESEEYAASIPPLAPLHGQAGVESSVSCPGRTSVAPDGGAPGGGTPVVLTGGNFAGATAVHFGVEPASAFSVTTESQLEAVAPAGTGTVPVTVTTPEGTVVTVGTFTYFEVSGIETAAGSAAGGNTVTIHGNGFTGADGVVFGTMVAPSFTVVSNNEIQATAPVGLGNVDVQVVRGFALTQPVANAVYTYQGGPPGAAYVSEGTAETAYSGLASQDSTVCSNIPDPSDSGGINFAPLCGYVQDQLSLSGVIKEYGDSVMGVALAATPAICVLSLPVCGAALAVEAGYFLWRVGVRACLLNCPDGELFRLWIDPSGTVINTRGNPIEGATATLLEQSLAASPFMKVEPSSGAIEPAENPETTTASGQFDWNALAGTYEMEASAPGCHAPGEESQPDVFTSPFVLPPPAVGLVLTLECAGGTAPTPKVSGLSVPGGATAGGNVVDILGEGLADVTAVHFGVNTSVHVQPLSPYAVAGVAPAGASGTVDVTVSGLGATSATTEGDRYSYSTPVVTERSPVIESVVPDSGPPTGGTVVTIKGSHLDGAFAVEFGGIASTQVTPISASEVQAVAPAAAFPARVDITVTTSSGGSAPTLADSFTYGSPPPPVATSLTLTPSPNPATAGQPVGLTAVVAPTDGGGTVEFYADGSSTPISGCGAQTLSQAGASFQATCSTTGLAAGSHTVSAAYSGDASYAGSAGSTNLSVESRPESIGGGGGSTTGGGGNGGGGSPGAKGGVLGNHIAKASAAQIAALLAGQLTPSGRAAKIAVLVRRRGWAEPFRALEAGMAVIDWYELPKGATLARGTKVRPVLVATGHLAFSAARTETLNVKLTNAGERLLQHAKHLKLTAKGTFTPTGAAPITATKIFVVKR
jgi:hypothetical protein